MTVALLVVAGAILVGLPLVAVVLARVLPPPRHRPPPRADPQDALRRRFRLAPSQLDEVEAAVRQGRVVADPALRAAARAAAEHALAPATVRGRTLRSTPVAARVGVGVLLVVALLAYGVALSRLRHPELAVAYPALYLLTGAGGLLARRRRRERARRALAANA